MAKKIDNRERLIFAMDVPDCNQAKQLVETLDDSIVFFKLGLELMMTDGYFDLMDWMLKRNKKIFADLKFFDIPATVGAAVNRLQNRGASFVTVHGNQAIMEAAAKNKGKHLKVLAVTALTSLDRGDLDDMGLRKCVPCCAAVFTFVPRFGHGNDAAEPIALRFTFYAFTAHEIPRCHRHHAASRFVGPPGKGRQQQHAQHRAAGHQQRPHRQARDLGGGSRQP